MYSFELWETFRGLYEGLYMCFPEFLDSLKSSEYLRILPNLPTLPNMLNELNLSKVSGCPGYFMNTIIPRTIRTSLNTSNTPYLSVHSEHFKRVKHFEPLGLSSSLKEIDLNALECVER